jgi:hypothetical protein
MHKKVIVAALLLMMMLVVTACDWSLLSLALGSTCGTNPDSAHCYQGEAVQAGDASICDNIKVPKEFEKGGSNPPKDKCYLMVAQNTGDYAPCKKIQGGYMSYTKEECYTDVAVAKEDPAGCKMLTGSAFENCKSQVAPAITADKLTDINGQIDDLKSAAGKGDANAAKQLADLEKKKKDMLEFMTPAQQSEYLKKNREEIMSDVDDEDVKSEIAKDFTKLRTANPTLNIDQLVQKLKDIKEQKETVKRLDEEANTLMDEMKKHMEDYTDEKKQEMIDAATEKGWGWMKEKGGDNLKWGLSNLESMKEKYDKASEAYKKLDDQIKKIKGVYDEIKSIYTKVDSFNKLVAEGKIDKGQAKVLKGAVLLGKGLEYATGYVPVFGSTVSTVTKETFGVVIKVATQRAERSNSLQKCFDDPEHCDPNGISAY